VDPDATPLEGCLEASDVILEVIECMSLDVCSYLAELREVRKLFEGIGALPPGEAEGPVEGGSQIPVMDRRIHLIDGVVGGPRHGRSPAPVRS
jgi:hypothetical protein